MKIRNPKEFSPSLVFKYFSKKFKSNVVKILRITTKIINIINKANMSNC